MSLFAEMESQEPEKRGLLGRLKAFKAGFTDSSSSAMPIVGREPVDGGESVVEVDGPREPRFKTTSKAVNPRQAGQGQPMTMGMMLRRAQDEIEDVSVFEEDPASPRAVAVDVPPVCDVGTQKPDEARTTVNSDATRSTVEVRVDSVASSEPGADPVAARTDAPVNGATRAPEPSDSLDAEAVKDREAASSRPAGYDDRPTVRRIGTDVAEAPEVSIETGRPRLVHADALTFKRVLCQRDENAALAVTESARREFIAVELQAGISIVVSTQRFHESELYATYLKDLARADISVHEEMVASEEVIAALYTKEKQRAATAVPESSRAIGAFRDVIEAATAYGAGDVHYEYREYAEDVELRLRVDGEMYSYRKMPKALVRRALSATYQDLVQRNTNSGETFQPSAPQSAMIPLVAHMNLVNIRWQSAPLVGGFDVALRLLDGNFKRVKVLLPHEMGLETSQLEILESLGKVTGGATFLTGETGSAKTTLLRAMSYLVPNRDRIKQFAVNEPSEVPAPWLSDISIQRRPNETEEDANRKIVEVVRTLMRMDPDDLTIGEVRDSVLAGLVAELALTGHPVRTTLHGNSILGAVMRLVGGRLKLPMDEVASGSFLNAVC